MALSNSGEEIKRLKPKQDVIRKLYLVSGNRCCYPGCAHLIAEMIRAGNLPQAD